MVNGMDYGDGGHTRHTAVEKCTLMMSGDAHRQIFNLGHEK